MDRFKIWIASALAGMLAAQGCSSVTGRVPVEGKGQDPAPVLVETVRPQRGEVIRRIDVVATLDPWEEAVLYAKTSGYLQSIRVDRGDRVKRGDLLAVLDIPEMADERRQLEAQEGQAAAEVEKARAEVRLQELIQARLVAIRSEEPMATTAQEIDLATGKLEAARGSLGAAESRLGVVGADLARLKTMQEYSRIVAPFDGIIIERYVDPGALITAGTQSKPTPIAKIADSSRLRAMVDVPETEVAHLAVGRLARLRVDAYPDRMFEGAISRFSGALDPKSRTMRTEILLTNKDGALTSGMFGRLSLDLERRQDVLTLPAGVLHHQKQQVYVFLIDGGQARRVDVVCGADDGNVVEILSGLSGTESIISKAPGSLSDGQPVVPAAVEPGR